MAGGKRAILKSARRKYEKVYKGAAKKAKKSGSHADKFRTRQALSKAYWLENAPARELKKYLTQKGRDKLRIDSYFTNKFQRRKSFLEDRESVRDADISKIITKRAKNKTLERRSNKKTKGRGPTHSPVLRKVLREWEGKKK